MAYHSLRSRLEHSRPVQREQSGHSEEGSFAMLCFCTFVASAAATLIVCGLAPAPSFADLWHSIGANRVDLPAKGEAKGASAGSGLSFT